MNVSELISVRVPKKTAARLKKLAKVTDRSKSYLAAQAIEQYIAEEEDYIRKVQEGIDAMDRGEFYTHEEMLKRIKNWGKK